MSALEKYTANTSKLLQHAEANGHAAAHCELETGIIAADDMVDEAVRLRLQRRHVPVTVYVLFELHGTSSA